MQLAVVEDVHEFAAQVEPILSADPVRHTVLLTVLDAVRRGGAPIELMLVARATGGVVGAALRTPGRTLQVSAMPAHLADDVAGLVTSVDPAVPGVSGPLPEADVFAAAIAARTGAAVRTHIRNRLFLLGDLVEPVGVQGRVRAAIEADIPVLAEWRRAFTVEAHGTPWNDPVSAEDAVARSLRLGSAEMLWEVDGVPVSQASARPVLAGTSRIGPVYTPPEHRRHGYAAGVTAAASRWALDAGAERVLLFTDLANPTSNALYPRIGYRPLGDFADLDLVEAADVPR
jgi:predicted GNAT family acetyltransferase